MRLRLSLVFVALLVLCGSLAAAPPNWVSVTPDNDWLDTASIKRIDGKLVVWFLRNYPSRQIYPYNRAGVVYGSLTYQSSADLVSIDCKSGKWATLQVGYYTDPKMTGEFLGSFTTPDNAITFSYPIPGTIGSIDVDFACAGFSRAR